MSRLILEHPSAEDFRMRTQLVAALQQEGETSIEFRERKGSCEGFGWPLFKSL